LTAARTGEVLVIGAGPSGATIAHVFAENAFPVTVADRASAPGGLCHTSRDPRSGIMVHTHDCWDNAVTETLFGSLEVERRYGMRLGTRRAEKDEVMDWLQSYNHGGLHSRLGYLSPMNFEKARAKERKGLGEEEGKAA
jgi:transposase InsO family protein